MIRAYFSILALTAVAILLPSTRFARAEDMIRIVTGGPSTAKKFQPVEAEIEKSIQAKIEVTVNPIDVALIAVSKGTVDGMIGPLDETFSSAEKRANERFNRNDYQWSEVSKSAQNIGLHPSNPAKTLTREQISGILSGKITNWESINGQKLPITVMIATNYIAAMKAMNQFYIKADSSPVAQHVKDKNGLLNGLKKEPGAIAFFTAKESLPGFTPKWVPSEVVTVNVLIMKKQPTPAAKRLFDYLKANPKILQ